MDNSLHTLGNDLQEILGDLEPTTTTTPPTNAPEPSESLPAATVPVEKIIQHVRDIQRLSQELLSWLQTTTTPLTPVSTHSYVPTSPPESITETGAALGKTLEGHFSGEKMIGDDGHEYSVPPNYASKSKLVTGDRMKLTITTHGAFIYKQIGPIERKRVIGTLQFEPEHNRWTVQCPEAQYRVLPASISFYKGKPGDEVILFVPEHTPAEWGAVDQLIAK